MPIAHAEGCYTDSEAALDALESAGPRRLPLRRRATARAPPPANPNGSSRSIAGITNADGNVLGMMPHPERCAEEILGNRDGLALFASLVEAAARADGAVVAGARVERRRRIASRRARQSTRRWRASSGSTSDEFAHLEEVLGRRPSYTELGIASALWSEHCSYKSSKVYLRELPTSGPRVVHGPGENAGVVDVGDGWVVAFKMESHNHPSFIEPYQGAATGVGGILRDVFTMGARPIACMDSLRFGAIDAPRMRHLVDGVVRGIGDYGNCVGIPTVGGETGFHSSYNGNILVNAFALGLARADGIFLAKARGVGNPVFYVGSRTGRDGIHGATMASEAFDQESEAKRPTVQVGDPVHREDPARGLPRGDADRRGGGDPGHGRGRPHQLVARDGGPRRARPASRPRSGAAARARALARSRSCSRSRRSAWWWWRGAAARKSCVACSSAGSSRWSSIGELTDDGIAELRFGGATVGRIPIEPLTDERAGVPAARSSRPPISRVASATPRCRRSTTSGARSSDCSRRPSSATSRGSGASTTTRCAATP